MKPIWRPEATGRGGWQLVDQYGTTLKCLRTILGTKRWCSVPFRSEAAAQRKADQLNNAPVEEKLWG